MGVLNPNVVYNPIPPRIPINEPDTNQNKKPATNLVTDTIKPLTQIVQDSLPLKKIKPTEVDYYPTPTKKDSLK